MRKRRKLLVDRRVQGTLLRQVLIHWVLVLAGTLVLACLVQLLRGGLEQSWSEVAGNLWSLYAPLFVSLAALSPVILYDMVKMSSRFAGPIVRLRRALQQMSRGDQVEPIRFREQDFWQDLATAFNEAALRMQNAEKQGAQPAQPAPPQAADSPSPQLAESNPPQQLAACETA